MGTLPLTGPDTDQNIANWRSELYALGLGSKASYDWQALYRFDGERWRQLEGVLPSGARLIVASSNSLFMAGAFTNVGNVPARNVAAWDGTSWQPLVGQSHAPGPVQCAAVGADGRLYVAGRFSPAIKTGQELVLAWNGSDWIAPAGGIVIVPGSEVHDMVTTAKGELYLAVEVPGTDSARHELVRFDGVRWQRYPSSAAIQALAATPDGTIYCAGRFDRLESDAPCGVGRWDGQRWRPLGQSSVNPQTNSYWEASTLAFWQGSLFAGGSFRKVGDLAANCIVGWNGTNWFPLGSGLGGGPVLHADFTPRGPVYFETSYPEALIPTDSALLVFGSFTQAGGVGVHGVAKWDGTRWRLK